MTDIVERLLKLAERERPYGSLPDALEEAAAEIERLRAALSGVLWMAEEWFEHGGDETTLADDFEKQIEAANAALDCRKMEGK